MFCEFHAAHVHWHLIFVYNSNVQQNFEIVSEWREGKTVPNTLFSLKTLENGAMPSKSRVKL